MAHLMKANRNQVGGLTRHFERYKKENGVLHNSKYDKLTKRAENLLNQGSLRF